MMMMMMDDVEKNGKSVKILIVVAGGENTGFFRFFYVFLRFLLVLDSVCSFSA